MTPAEESFPFLNVITCRACVPPNGVFIPEEEEEEAATEEKLPCRARSIQTTEQAHKERFKLE